MRSYMNLAVLALAVSSVSTALSAPIQNRCGNLFVESNGRAFLISGISRVPRVDSDLFRRVEFPRFRRSYDEDNIPLHSLHSPQPDASPPRSDYRSEFFDSEDSGPGIHTPPVPVTDSELSLAPPPSKYNRLKTALANAKNRYGLVAVPALGLSAILIGVPTTLHFLTNQAHNSTRRAFEAFEGSVNAELVRRALGDHDLDK